MNTSVSAPALVSLRNLSRNFSRPGGFMGVAEADIPAVCAVSLDIAPGETLGLVGESGCGKSTLGRMVVGLLEPSGGDVFIQGRPLWDQKAHADYQGFRKSLAGVIQMIFQDPYSSLNPRLRIGYSIGEALYCSSLGRKKPLTVTELKERVRLTLEKVGLDADAASRSPHEFSGGQRQRVAIARALISSPAFVVCDEPTSALDVSVQAQILNLLRDMQDELGLAYLFISHDLEVVRHMSDRIAVMHRGSIVEEGAADAVFSAPSHPYTRLLLDSLPGR
ncbi:MAG: ATP-binding cassette domain-containing protein [Desulfovibrio sp.]|nr:ATP-binding cassette domain-containing protein [Desulfovibrio sp.]